MFADKQLLSEWIRLEKIFSGAPRLVFVTWKRRREERARTINGGIA
jgi:hypothetical protein